MDRAKSIEDYHRQFIDILRASRVYQSGDSVLIPGAGHEAIRALVEEIHDQGYVLGQLHADGIFQPGEEADVAALEDRLGIDQMKTDAHRRADQVTTVDRIKADLEAAGIPLHDALRHADPSDQSDQVVRGLPLRDPAERGMNLLQDVEHRAERLRNEHRADRNGTD